MSTWILLFNSCQHPKTARGVNLCRVVVGENLKTNVTSHDHDGVTVVYGRSFVELRKMTHGYKTDKEAFVSGMTGSSITHVNLVSLVALASVSLYAAIQTRLRLNRGNTRSTQDERKPGRVTRPLGFLPSWLILVLPLLLSMTLFANQPTTLLVVLSVPTGLLLFLPKPKSGIPLPLRQPLVSSASTSSNAVQIPPLPALTTYRAHMMLMTVLAILAVDFPVFPRSLVKCETFGVSLMDLGVGSFVFSQGIVSAIQLIKDPAYLTSPVISKFIHVTRKSLPIIVLGLIRVFLVKGTDYPEHETEYGRHWNFFITLALLPIIQVLLHPVLLYFPISLVGVVVGLSHELALSHLGLRDYLLFAPRNCLIGANKEGIISLPGYLAIQLLGLSVGTIILPSSPSFFRRQQSMLIRENDKRRNSDPATNKVHSDIAAPRQTRKVVTELCSFSVIWWAFLGLLRFFNVGGTWGPEGGVSRRMANLPYILWITAFNTSFLLLYLALDTWIFSVGDSGNFTKHHQKADAQPPVIQVENPPPLLDLINRHSLAIFLLANILTGLINLTISTMYISDVWALTILVLYSVTLCGVPHIVTAFWRTRK